MDKILFFFHIEKCGGTTFHHLLRYNFPTYITLSPNFYSEKDNTGGFINENTVRKIFRLLPYSQGIGGHTLRPQIDYQSTLRRNTFKFAFLREPVSRFISHLNYLGMSLYKDGTFEKYFENPKYNNFMTKRLAGKEDLHIAKKVLNNNLDFIGLTDMYDESLLILRSKIGRNHFSPYYQQKNVLHNKNKYTKYENLNDDLKERIISKNKLDIDLYEYAKKNIFRKYIKEYGECFSADIKKFREINTRYKYNYLKAKISYGYRVSYHLLCERNQLVKRYLSCWY